MPIDGDSYRDEETGEFRNPLVVEDVDPKPKEPVVQQPQNHTKLLFGLLVCFFLAAIVVIVPTTVALTRKHDSKEAKDPAPYILINYDAIDQADGDEPEGTLNNDADDADADKPPVDAAQKDPGQLAAAEGGAAEQSLFAEDNRAGEFLANPSDASLLSFPYPKDAELPTFSEEILLGYNSREELEEDIVKAAKHMVHNIIVANIYREDQRQVYSPMMMHGGDMPMPMPVEEEADSMHMNNDFSMMEGEEAATEEERPMVVDEAEDMDTEMNMDAEEEMETGTATVQRPGSASVGPRSGKEGSGKAKDEKSGGDDEEEEDREADFLVEDDNYMYAAYGDHVIAWDRDGEVVDQVRMPRGEPDPWGYEQNAHIRSLLLTEDHVVVVANRYNHGRCYYRRRKLSNSTREEPMMHYPRTCQESFVSGDSTEVRIYSKPAKDQTMEFVSLETIQGSFQYGTVAPEGDIIRIITSTWLNAYFHGLDVYNFKWVTKEMYVEAATEMAEKTLIPKFVNDITEKLFPDGEDTPNVLRVISWNTENQPLEGDQHGSNIFDNYNQITSIDVGGLNPGQGKLETSVSSFFGPHMSGSFSDESSLVLTMGTNQWDQATGRNTQTLFLLATKPDSEDRLKTNFHSIAQLDGYLSVHNSRNIVDIQGSDLRVATTIRKYDPYQVLYATCGDIYYQQDLCITMDNWLNCSTVAWECPGTVTASGGCPYTSFTCDAESPSFTENYVTVLDFGEPGEMMVSRGQVQVGNDHEHITAVHFGESTGYITTYNAMAENMRHRPYEMMMYHGDGHAADFPSDSEEVPSIKESFYSVDLPAGEAPSLQSEVVLEEGTRSKLFPLEVKGEETLLLGIGRNTSFGTYNGMGPPMPMPYNTFGLISVFDVSNPEEVKVMASTMLGGPADGFETWSEAEWDPKATELFDGGILVMPIHRYPVYHHYPGYYYDEEGYEFEDDYAPDDDMAVNHTLPPGSPPPMMPYDMQMPQQEFRGFVVYDVSNVGGQGIVESFRINHSRSQEMQCRYCEGYFQGSRSYMFVNSDGSKVLVTVSGDYVVGTDMTTGEELWAMAPAAKIKGVRKDCCW